MAAPAFCSVKTGDPAPAIALEAIIPDQPPSHASLKALEGKAVVLEFWATWCGPCVEAIPHFNQLVKRFEGRPIQFISVTSEDSAVVKRFLNARPIAGWIGLDPANKLFKEYGLEALPSTVLIDSHGMIAGMTQPATLTEKNLEDLLAGKEPEMAPAVGSVMKSLQSGLEAGSTPMLDIIVRRSSGTTQGMQMSVGKHQWLGTTMRELFAAVYSIPSSFVEGDGMDDRTSYDVSVFGPGSEDEALQKALPELLGIAFQVTTKREVRETDGWIVVAPAGRPPGLVKAAGAGGVTQAGGGILKMTGMGMGQLVAMMQRVLNKPVVDKTGIEGRFDVSFQYDQDKPETLLEAMRKDGFDFKASKLATEFLVVTNKDRPVK